VGLDREQLLGDRFGELFPQFPGSERFSVYRRVAETGQPCRTEAVHGEGAWPGTLLATRIIDTVIAPMGENLVVSARDVTERKRNEQEMRLRGELLDLAHDAVIVRDPVESRVRFWNREAEAIYGYSRAEAIGRLTYELLETVFPETAHAVDAALAWEGQWDGELRHTRKDGTVIVAASRQPPGAGARRGRAADRDHRAELGYHRAQTRAGATRAHQGVARADRGDHHDGRLGVQPGNRHGHVDRRGVSRRRS